MRLCVIFGMNYEKKPSFEIFELALYLVYIIIFSYFHITIYFNLTAEETHEEEYS